jgi:tetratricopeptide (TPR) repeat protein
MEEVMRLSGLVCLGAMILFAPSEVAAQTQASGGQDERAPEARVRYERGLQLYNEGASEGALVEFERAYQLAPSYKLLYNIALIRLQLNDYAQALKAFQEYLAEGGTEIASVRRSEVERHLAGLKHKVGRVELVSGARGADVLVDDVVVGRVPLAELLVLNPGRRRITIARGGLSSTTVVTVAGQDYSKVEMSLDSPKPQPAAPVGVAASPNRVPVYVSWTATAALAATTTVVGILALGAMSDLEDERRAPTTRARLDEADSKMGQLALATDILVGATAIAGVTALYFTLSKPSTEASSREDGVRVGFGLTTLRVEHRF